MNIYHEHNDFVKNEAYYEYCALISKAIIRVSQDSPRKTAKQALGYCEHHHIIPTCIGGDNSLTNKVWLTAYEHLVAHILLIKFCKKTQSERKLSAALVRMLNKQDHRHQRIYEEDLSPEMLREVAELRVRAANLHSEYMKEKHKGENNPMYGKKCSEYAKERARIYWKGAKRSDENRKKCSISKMGDLNPSKQIVTCPVCGKIGQSGGMRKNHFGYCIDLTVFTLKNTVTEEVFVGTRDQFVENIKAAKWQQYRIGSLLRGKIESFKDWIITSE